MSQTHRVNPGWILIEQTGITGCKRVYLVKKMLT